MEDRLRKLARIVDSGGYSKAAAAMHISQPALTAAVKKLERELGMALLERGNKSIVLTPAGQAAYRTSKRLASDVRNLTQELAVLAAGKPPVRLGMVDSIADLLTGTEDGFARLKQHADLSLVVDSSRQLTAAVVSEKLDAAIIVGGPFALPEAVSARPLGHEPLVLVLHPAQRDRYVQSVAEGRLPNFISYNARSHSQQLIETALGELGVSVEPAFYSTSPEVMFKMALLGQGAAILPYGTVKQDIRAGKLASIPVGKTGLSRPIYTIRLTGRELLPETTQTFDSAAAALRRLWSELR